ncbi:hypothetical protein ECG_03277 [Echinococcus granulosus]|nr:hypothetical protein ECG_03277 [Echinococcus granulosus]
MPRVVTTENGFIFYSFKLALFSVKTLGYTHVTLSTHLPNPTKGVYVEPVKPATSLGCLRCGAGFNTADMIAKAFDSE